MGINIFPAPIQTVSLDTNGNTTKVANNSGLINNSNPLSTSIIVNSNPVSASNPLQVNVIDQRVLTASSVKFNLSNNKTGQTLVNLVNGGNHLVVHQISMSNHLYGSLGDRLGVMIHSATTPTNISNTNVIAANYIDKGTVFFNFGSGLRLPAGRNLYYAFDYNGGGMDVNGFITITYVEVSP